MKKCTLCVDRIYNENFAVEDRVPACVKACPTGARSFGDLGDPGSAVSQLVREREGHELLPELGYKPVNRYLAPRKRSVSYNAEPLPKSDGSAIEHLFAWADKLMSRKATANANAGDHSGKLEG
jgi:hypothetical protein